MEEWVSGVVFFLWWVVNGNSIGLNPKFSLLDLVNTPEDCKDKETLPSNISL